MPTFTATNPAPGATSSTTSQSTGIIQSWTVPAAGRYRIEAAGAAGGQNASTLGGKSARLIGYFNLVAGQVIKVLVGQQGGYYSSGGSGGGGSFVWIDGPTPTLLLAAGGGGGAVQTTVGGNASLTQTSGIPPNGLSTHTSSGGAGGQLIATGGSSAGAGWNSDGTDGYVSGGGGKRPLHATTPGKGGLGGACNSNSGGGGFGGGGGGEWCTNGSAGGGGGYSGGWGSGNANCAGGGGGSYSAGEDTQADLVGVSNGYVTILAGDYIAPTIVLSGSSSVAYASGNGIAWTADPNVDGTVQINSISYSPKLRLFVAVGLSGGIYSSPKSPTRSWTKRAAGLTTQTLNHVIWAAGLGVFVAVGASGTILTSPDGVNWTPRTSGSTFNLLTVAYSPTLGRLVAGGSSSRSYSDNGGVTWAAWVGTFSNTVQQVTWIASSGLFVAVQTSGYIHTSSDGITWTSRSSPYPTSTTYTGYCLAARPDGVVIAGLNNGYLMRSTDGGVTWASVGRLLGNVAIRTATYDPTNERFVIAGGSGVQSSPDGLTWDTVQTLAGGGFLGSAVSTNQAPSEPTNVQATPSVAQVGDNVILSWQHNDPDLNSQGKYQVRWRKIT